MRDSDGEAGRVAPDDVGGGRRWGEERRERVVAGIGGGTKGASGPRRRARRGRRWQRRRGGWRQCGGRWRGPRRWWEWWRNGVGAEEDKRRVFSHATGVAMEKGEGERPGGLGGTGVPVSSDGPVRGGGGEKKDEVGREQHRQQGGLPGRGVDSPGPSNCHQGSPRGIGRHAARR